MSLKTTSPAVKLRDATDGTAAAKVTNADVGATDYALATRVAQSAADRRDRNRSEEMALEAADLGALAYCSRAHEKITPADRRGRITRGTVR